MADICEMPMLSSPFESVADLKKSKLKNEENGFLRSFRIDPAQKLSLP